MRSVSRFGSIRAALSVLMVVALAGASIDEFSSGVVSDAKAATITGGNTQPCGNSSVIQNGTQSCLITSCPMNNWRAGGTGGNCVSIQPCGDCQCTYSGRNCGGP